jgi:hypothetical protein
LHPSHTNEFIQAEKDNPNLPTTRIVRVKPDAFGGVVGKRKYTDPYSEEKMRKYMRHSVGQFGLLDHISLIKENASNPIACRDIERAITGDFDTLFNEYSRVKPTVDIEEMSKKFAEALKKQTEKEADAAEHFQ